MNTKERLIEKISKIEDEVILKEIMEMVELELAGEEIKLTNEQKSFIYDGLKGIENGNIITDKEEKEMTKEWLKKR